MLSIRMPKGGRSIILEKHFVNVRVNLGGRGENQDEKYLLAKTSSLNGTAEHDCEEGQTSNW